MSEQGVGKKEEREEQPGAGQLLGTLSWAQPQPWHRPGAPTAAPRGCFGGKAALEEARMLLGQPGGAQGCSECTEGLLQQSRRWEQPGTDPAGAPTSSHPAESSQKISGWKRRPGRVRSVPCCHRGVLWPCPQQHPRGWMEQAQ